MSAHVAVGLVSLWGDPVYVDVGLLSGVSALPLAYENLGIVGCKVTLSSGGPYYVRGSVEDVTALLTAAVSTDEAAGSSYAPTLATGGGGTVTAVGAWTAHQLNGRVHVIGQLQFTPATPGTPETVTFTLPSDMQPVANFAAVTDLSGVAMTGEAISATDSVTQPQATVGAKTGSIAIDQTAAGATRIGVAFQYSMP